VTKKLAVGKTQGASQRLAPNRFAVALISLIFAPDRLSGSPRNPSPSWTARGTAALTSHRTSCEKRELLSHFLTAALWALNLTFFQVAPTDQFFKFVAASVAAKLVNWHFPITPFNR